MKPLMLFVLMCVFSVSVSPCVAVRAHMYICGTYTCMPPSFTAYQLVNHIPYFIETVIHAQDV